MHHIVAKALGGTDELSELLAALRRRARLRRRRAAHRAPSSRVTVSARDALAHEGESKITLEIAPGHAVNLSAAALEEGTETFTGALGDGAGKWRLRVEADNELYVASLMYSRSGHVTNLSR